MTRRTIEKVFKGEPLVQEFQMNPRSKHFDHMLKWLFTDVGKIHHAKKRGQDLVGWLKLDPQFTQNKDGSFSASVGWKFSAYRFAISAKA